MAHIRNQVTQRCRRAFATNIYTPASNIGNQAHKSGTSINTSTMNILGPFWTAWDYAFLRSNTSYFTLIVVLSFGIEGILDRARDKIWLSNNEGKMFHHMIVRDCYNPHMQEEEEDDDDDDDDDE